jgi:hypothetical protein
MSGLIRDEETAVALQGTIDSFPLVDVLALLESSGKTGRLEVVGDRGRGTLWVDGGELVAAEIRGSGEVEATDAVWELLRFNDGSFEFDSGSEPPGRAFAASVGETVEGAQKMLSKWEKITERVPGLGHVVRLTDKLPGEDVRLSPDDWAVLVAAGPSRSVAEVLEVLGASEFAGCAKLAELVDRSLVLLDEPTAATTAPAQSTPAAARELAEPAPSDPERSEPPTEPPSGTAVVLSEPSETVETGPEPVTSPDPGDPVAADPEPRPGSQQSPEPEQLQDGEPEQADESPDDGPLTGQLPESSPQTMDQPADGSTSADGAGDGQPATSPSVAETADPVRGGAPEPAPAQFPEHFPIDDLVGDEGAGWEQALRSSDRAERQTDTAGRHADAAATPTDPAGVASHDRGGSPPEAAAPSGHHHTATARTEQPDLDERPMPAAASDDAVQQSAPAAGQAPEGNGAVPDADSSSEDVLSQISRLSPKAAEAIAAALGDEGSG